MTEVQKVKPATTFEEQVAIMKNRGLIIVDDNHAVEILSNINYYRFSAYALTLKNRHTDRYHEGVTFEHIFALYEFDRKLRHSLSGVLESIEISFRTHLAYELAHSHGPLGYQQSEYFRDERYHREFLESIQTAINKKQEVFIEHHLQKYEGKFPIWTVVELLSFGAVSKLYANLNDSDRASIADKYYGVSYEYLETWLRSAVHVRNVCAHYSRIYNKFSKVTPRLHARYKKMMNPKKIFTSIFVFRELHPHWNEWCSFVTGLEALIDEYRDRIDLYTLGFPNDWVDILMVKPPR